LSEKSKQYYQENRGRLLEKFKQWRQQNPNRIKQWRQENREYHNKYCKQWRQQNPDYMKQWRQENREHYIQYNKQWRQQNPEKKSAYDGKRRALKFENTPDVIFNSLEEKNRIENVYKLRNLLTKATGIEHHVDHIWPLSKGGPHWSGNLQIITAEENLRKGDSIYEKTARVIQESLDEHYSPRQ
jgi:5-methylcytosine-specific restriction endonuclease McrA